ncbi:MAG: nitroreductase family protein [Nitrospiraceae bacterium]|nr:nitroreductase family protein [Nitrospiraceae bacterium]
MNVYTAIKERRSIRCFEKKDIPQDAVERLIDALLWAPSAGNLQSRKFYFVRDAALKQRLGEEALGQRFLAGAPIVIVACADERAVSKYGPRGTGLYCVQDASISIMGMMLAAHELGLGSVWVGAFSEEGVSGVLDLPSWLRPVAIVPVGYPAETPRAPKRVSSREAVLFL